MTKKSDKGRRLALTAAISVLAIAILLFVLSVSAPTSADTVVGYVSFYDATLDGTNVYTTSQTATSGTYLVANFSHVQVQSTAAITTGSAMTVSLQFYNGPLSCSSATAFYTAEEIGYYTTQTIPAATPVALNTGLAEVQTSRTIAHSAAGNKGRSWPIEGKCMRFSVAGSANFTPTLNGRMVNTR